MSFVLVRNMILKTAAKFLIFEVICTLTLGHEHQLYNIDCSICCKGVVHPKLNDTALDPNNPYYRQVCCGSELITYPPEDKFKQAKLNNKPIPVCCNEKIENITNDFMCCGDVIIDKSRFSCYENRIKIPISNRDYQENKTELCGKDEENLEFYNSKEKICCGGKAEPAVNPDTKCCGSVFIDLKTHICCQYYFFEDEDFEYEGMDVQEVPVPLKDRYRNDTECCSLELYDINTQDCINGFLVDKGQPLAKHCCGKTYICNESNADWTMSERSSGVEDENVCYELIIFDKNYPCYLNVLQDEEKEEEFCPGVNETYNTYTQSCCPSKVANLTTTDFDEKNYECCEYV